ncbi:hypothetical protein OAB00_02985 [Akkermansiaceae bacterium]|nr:hypothetical protein [Akkermansiaceae bacterium]
MINNSTDLAQYIDSLTPGFFAMDLEADGLHRYGDSLCLIQCTDGEKHQLIDPLAFEDMDALVHLVEKSEIWMHGADYDMTLMQKAWAKQPKLIFDTQIASRLVGAPRFGYGNLVQDYLGVELDKASQKADWSKRPLTEKMEEYALNDVVYLRPLAELLLEKLHEHGRYDWFLESCQTALDKASERIVDKVDSWRIKGSGKLTPKGLAFLKVIWNWREKEAEEWNKPVFMVCSNSMMIQWATELSEDKIPELPKHFRSRRVNKFIGAANRVRAMKPADYPQKPKVERFAKDPLLEDKIDATIKKKNKIAAELNIDSSLLSNRVNVEAIVRGSVAPEDCLMNWQLALIGDIFE